MLNKRRGDVLNLVSKEIPPRRKALLEKLIVVQLDKKCYALLVP
jgi:hypothetical protein